MTLTERLKDHPIERRLPNNIVPMQERRGERRAEPRWREWAREHQSAKDITPERAA